MVEGSPTNLPMTLILIIETELVTFFYLFLFDVFAIICT